MISEGCVCACMYVYVRRVGARWGGGGCRFDNITIPCMYSDKHTFKSANSEDPDQTPQNAASDQGLLCLTLIQQFDTYSWIENGLVEEKYKVKSTQQTHDVYTTSPQRRCNVMTLHRR